MPDFDLKKLLKINLDGAERVAVLGVGSELRADDIAGMTVAALIDEHIKKDSLNGRLKVFFGATAPENLTGEIKRYAPTHLIIVDAADTGAEPGTIDYIKPEEVAGISFSTHMMPIKILVDYLNQSFPCEVTIIGIQPKVLSFGKSPSAEVKASASQVAASIVEVMTAKA